MESFHCHFYLFLFCCRILNCFVDINNSCFLSVIPFTFSVHARFPPWYLKVNRSYFLLFRFGNSVLKTIHNVVLELNLIQITLNKVLLVGTKTSTYIGKPIVPNATVEAIVEEQVRFSARVLSLYSFSLLHQLISSFSL